MYSSLLKKNDPLELVYSLNEQELDDLNNAVTYIPVDDYSLLQYKNELEIYTKNDLQELYNSLQIQKSFLIKKNKQLQLNRHVIATNIKNNEELLQELKYRIELLLSLKYKQIDFENKLYDVNFASSNQLDSNNFATSSSYVINNNQKNNNCTTTCTTTCTQPVKNYQPIIQRCKITNDQSLYMTEPPKQGLLQDIRMAFLGI